MVVDMAHARWRKKLLESRDPNQLYQLIGMREDGGAVDILFKFVDGQWQFKTDMSSPSVNFTDVDEATRFIIANGVERFSEKFGI